MNAVATSSMGSETLQAALWFAEHDIPVFPCHYPEGLNGCSCHDPRCTSQGKHPLTRHGFLDATTDLQQIREWWEQWPEANLAIPTGTLSGLLVVDFDPRDGAPSDRDGCAEVIGRIPDNAAEATSGGNGRHIYFQYNPALFPWKIPQYIAPGVEVKATGDYVITAPSRHVSGKRYEWDGMEGRNHLLRLPSPTPTLIEKINTAARQKPTLPAEERIWGQGERNNQLTRLAGAMRRHGTSAGVIETALQEANRKQCNPPLGEEEVRQISLSVSRYAPAQVAPDYVIREESNSSNGTRPAPVRTESAAAGKRCPVSAGSDELFSGEYPKVASMIDKILYPGVTLLQSPPKFGKSYWALQASLNLIEGTAFMDYFEVPKKLRVLYVDIEGTKGRAHDRLNQLGELTENSRNLQFMFRPFDPWPNNLQQIEEQIKKWEIELVIFDTLLALLIGPGHKSRDIVRQDYDNIDKIREICARNNASALVVSHAKKHTAGMAATDAGIHSTGTSASVDSLITLKRSGNGNVTLEVLPRDGEPGEYEIQLDPENHQGWHLLGFGADVGQSRERRAILNVFREAGKPLTPHDVAVALGKNDSTIRTLIQKLASDGKLESLGKGLYRFEEVKP
ncbi:MAG: bifunctional DNA primase/polymerase [Bryobacteraceae bacterium]